MLPDHQLTQTLTWTRSELNPTLTGSDLNVIQLWPNPTWLSWHVHCPFIFMEWGGEWSWVLAHFSSRPPLMCILPLLSRKRVADSTAGDLKVERTGKCKPWSSLHFRPKQKFDIVRVLGYKRVILLCGIRKRSDCREIYSKICTDLGCVKYGQTSAWA